MIRYDADWRSAWPALLIVGVLALLPVGRGYAEAALDIAAIAGVILCVRHASALRDNGGIRLAVILFASYWLAAAISLPGAIAPSKSARTVVEALRFLPFAAFACIALRDGRWWARIVAACAAIVVLWLLDGWVQIFTGYSIAGAMSSERLSGIFGANDLKLGPVLAVLSPFVFVAARERFGWRGLVLAFVFQLMPILLAGSRAAWLMFALVTLVFAWREARSATRFVAFAAIALLVACVAAAVAWHASSAFDARVQRSLLVFGGSQHAVDEAAAGRLRIWGTAVRMIESHAVNGVGVRGFRYAYPAFAEPGDTFVDNSDDQGASHAHQIFLEVLSETGLIGLILWLIGAAAAVRAWLRADAASRHRALAPALALGVMCFPINTHLAFYSAWWGLMFWWLIALYCAALGARE